MLALILPLDGFVLYLLWRRLLPEHNWRKAFLAAYVCIGVMITISTELLGSFHAITPLAILLLWLALLFSSLFLLYKQRAKLFTLKLSLKISSKLEWSTLLIISAYLLITLIIALISPPNTNDSLQYHMSRVMHWIVNRSVNFYATPIDRQLWMPPFAEYSILHMFLLAGNDRFVNLVQWFSAAGSIIAVTLVAEQIGVGRRGQWFAALFTLTLPMGVLQSTSTQTDYVNSLWYLCFLYFILSESRKYSHEGNKGFSINSILLGFSFSLAVFTKGTIYAFVLPVLLYFLVILIRRRLWKVITGMAVLGGLCVVCLNGPLWFRNTSTYKSIFGPGVESLGSSSYDPRLILSTVLKNATNQLALPAGPGNKAMYVVVNKIDEIMGIDLNDPRVSLNQYRIRYSNHEDYAGNPLQFLFWVISVIYLSFAFVIQLSSHCKQGKSKIASDIDRIHLPAAPPFSYTLILVIAYILFSLLFKWQSYNSRLLLPWLTALGPLAGWIFEIIRPRAVWVGLVILFAFGGLPSLLANPSRPIISVGENKSVLLTSRTEVMFYNFPEIRNEFISVISEAKNYDRGTIGLELDSNTPEYLLWYLLAANDEPVFQVENISSTPETSSLVDPDYRPSIIFCNICTVAKSIGYQQTYQRGSMQLFVETKR
jgi:4-amino-4-deoxy-L-arabinose transferase-like glycosyltransferase